MLTYWVSYMRSFLNSRVCDEDGQDLAEYALLIALIAIVAVIAITLLGSKVSTIFSAIAGYLNLT